MSISPPSGRWKRTAMPCGLALGSPSGMVGTPVASENRTVTGISPPWNSAAVLSAAPAALGAKLPSATIPLAWLARMPGWRPNSWFITSTICSPTVASSAYPAPGSAQVSASAIVAARQMRMVVPPRCKLDGLIARDRGPGKRIAGRERNCDRAGARSRP